MRGLGVAALFCVVIVGLHLDVVSGDLLDTMNVDRIRSPNHTAGSLRVLGRDVERVSDNEYNRTAIPPENQPAPVGATTCVSLPDDPSLILTCSYVGESVNCSTPAQVGTVASMSCSSGYKETHHHGYDSITCNIKLVWSNRLLHCVPDCGRQNAVRKSTSQDEEVDVGEFAWHVGIYQVNESQLYSQICGGSLITPGYVLTAAHCFWDFIANKVRAKDLFRIAAGKYYRDWYVDDRGVQRRKLSAIYLAPRFVGGSQFLAYDIALVRLDKDIKLSPLVNTICMDFDSTLEPPHLIPGRNGSIAGWRITDHNEPSDVLKSVQLPYIPVENCENIVEVKFQKFLTHDKFCAGYVNKSTGICPGDFGGGYVYPKQTADSTRFFLHGIASVGHRPRSNTGLKCQSEQVAAFTRVSLYTRWIKETLRGS